MVALFQFAMCLDQVSVLLNQLLVLFFELFVLFLRGCMFLILTRTARMPLLERIVFSGEFQVLFFHLLMLSLEAGMVCVEFLVEFLAAGDKRERQQRH